MTDASLITSDLLERVIKEHAGENPESTSLQTLAGREPVLAAYVSERIVRISGKLALSGAPPEIVRACYQDMLEAILVSLNAVWASHDELWRGVNLASIARTGARRKNGVRAASTTRRAGPEAKAQPNPDPASAAPEGETAQ